MSTPTTTSPVLHPAAWAAQRLNTTEDRVRRMAQRGELPHHKDGRYLRFTEDDIAAYLDMTAVPAAQHMGRSRASKSRKRRTS